MKITVIGAGFMGSGIAQVSAAAGNEVTLWDISNENIEKGIDRIKSSFEKRIAKGKATEADRDELLARITKSTVLADAVKDADWVVEAVLEKKELKQDIFKQVEASCREDAVLSSNTSSIPISELATVLVHPERFLGTHFFSPVPAMKLVELILGEKTSAQTGEKAKEIAKNIGKTPVFVKDSPGFLVNRINYALRMEAYRCMVDGIASVEDIDTALKLGLNHPMGPFELNDMAGLDVGLAGLDTMYKATGEERWAAPAVVREMVEKGELGKKTGKGWYDYTDGEKKARK